MIEAYENHRKVDEPLAFRSATELVSPQYREILGNLRAYQKLFWAKYHEQERNLVRLTELIGCSADDVEHFERNLEGYLSRVMGGSFRGDLLEMVCPECFMMGLSSYGHDGEEIKKACCYCGAEAPESFSDIDDFNQSLDRDVTMQPSSKISYSNGEGCTFNPNSDREHKNFLWGIVNSQNVLFNDVATAFPETNTFPAFKNQFKAGVGVADVFEVVWAGSYVYCRVGQFIKRAPIEDYFILVNSFWHCSDAPLRRSKLNLMIDVKSDLRRAKEYGLRLCEKYGFNNKDRDQAIYNTVGHEIALLKHQLKVQKWPISEKRLVETIFYICLLRFDKKGIATKVKSELDIDYALVNYYDAYKEFLRVNDKRNGSPALLDALEKMNGSRAI